MSRPLPLPATTPEEFRSGTSGPIVDQIAAGYRIGRLAAGQALEPARLIGLSVAGTTVLAVTTAEALLIAAPSRGRSFARFVARYALANVFPSIVWATKSPQIVARSIGLDPKKVLRAPWGGVGGGAKSVTKGPAVSKTTAPPAPPAPSRVLKSVREEAASARAARELRVETLRTLRSVIAGFVGIANVLDLVGVGTTAAQLYEERVASGHEPALPTRGETVVRLAGRSSDVTVLSMRRAPQGFLPVFEEPHDARHVIAAHSRNGRVPVIWTVRDGCYGKPSSWSNFDVGASWATYALATRSSAPRPSALSSSTSPSTSSSSSSSSSPSSSPPSPNAGRRILIIEADGSVGDESLALGRERANDLTAVEVAQAARGIRLRAVASGAVAAPRDVVTVLLADLNTPIETGGGGAVELGERVRRRKEADVLIDARKALEAAIARWAIARADGGRIVFETTQPVYFDAVARMLAKLGVEVLDSAPVAGDPERTAAKLSELPRLVYCDTTADTVHAVESLVDARIVDRRKVCALLDEFEGLDALAATEQFVGGGIDRVCSSDLYDRLFAQVRVRLREGYPVGDVQAEIDAALRVPGGLDLDPIIFRNEMTLS